MPLTPLYNDVPVRLADNIIAQARNGYSPSLKEDLLLRIR